MRARKDSPGPLFASAKLSNKLHTFQCELVSGIIRTRAHKPHFTINIIARATADYDDFHARALGPRTGAARKRQAPS